MLIKLHSQATTTPKIRAAIQASDEPAWVLAERHGTTEQTSKPSLPIRRGAGGHAAPLCLALQPATTAISLAQQVTLAGDQALVQTQTGAVQETATLPSGM